MTPETVAGMGEEPVVTGLAMSYGATVFAIESTTTAWSTGIVDLGRIDNLKQAWADRQLRSCVAT